MKHFTVIIKIHKHTLHTEKQNFQKKKKEVPTRRKKKKERTTINLNNTTSSTSGGDRRKNCIARFNYLLIH